MTNLILVGAFSSAVGLKGEVRLVSFTQDPEAIADFGPLIAKDGRTFELISIRTQTNGFVARVKGVATREAAEALKGIALHVPRERLPATEEDEYYFSDLVGLAAALSSGEPLGEIVAVHNFGAGDLLDVKLARESRTVLVPFTRAIVPIVDIKARRVVIDPPPGLMDDPAQEKPPRDDGEASEP